MPFVYDLSFAGIPFCLDGGTEVPSGDASPAARPYEQRGGILEEVNTILPFKYLKDFSIPSVYPGRNLGAVNYPNEMGPYPNPDVRVGDWYYPPGAKRWSVFRGLATSSMVKAMLAACRNTVAGFVGRANLANSGFSPLLTAELSTTGAFSGYFLDYLLSGNASYQPNNSFQYPTWTSLAGTIPNLFKIIASPQGAGEGGVPYGVSTLLYMLPPRPLAELGGSFDGLYLVTLVDERYYWQNTPVRLPIQQGMTWDYLLNELAIVLGIVLYTNSPIEDVYGKPELDSQLWTCQESAATLLDAVAANVGRTVVRRYDGTYVLYTPEESREIVRVNRGDDPALYYNLLPFSGNSTNPVTARSTVRTAGGDVFYSGTILPAGSLWAFKNAVAPFQIVTAFPKYVVGDDPVPHFSNPRYQGQRRSTWYEESYGDTYNVVVPILSGGPYVSGLVGASEMFLHDTAKALFSGEVSLNSGIPLNSSGLTALAMRLAQDFYTQQVGTGLDEVYPGTRRWEPEGVNDLVYSYSDQARGAFTRVMHPSWTQETMEYQHATPPMSGFTENPPGVGGPSVAQTWRDQFGASGSFIGSSGTEQYLFSGYPLSGLWWQSGAVCTTLGETLLSGSLTVNLSSVSFFPTGHRWYGKVIPLLNATGPQSGQQVTSGESEEVILFEGTSGGRAGVYSGNYVGIVQRGVQGTKQQHHANQSVVIQTVPDAGYAVNLVTHEKGQFVYPGAVTSGGIQEVQVVPQTQSVRILDTAGVVVSGIRHYSGVVNSYDPTTPVSGGPWVKTDYVWAVTRSTSDVLQSSGLYDGQFLGHSFAQSGMDSAPVYAVSAPSSDPLRVLSRMGGGGSNTLLKQPLYASQTWVVVDDVTNLPADQAWWAYVYTPGWSASGEILLMAPTSGGITGVDIGIRLSGYQYFSGGYWSGVINPSNPDYPTDMAEFGYFLKIVGRGMFNTQVLSGVVSGTSFDKSTSPIQGWSSGVGRLSFTHATSVPEGFSNGTMIHEAQMSFPGLNWVSGGTREQIIAPANRVIRIVSEQVLYISGYAALRPAQAYFLDFAGDSINAGYYTTSQSVWAQFLEEAYPPDIFGNNPLARRGYVGTQMASGLRLPAPDLTRPYFGNLVGYSTPFSGVLSPSANYRSRPVYVIQGQLPETATIRIASKTGDHTYQGQILAPDLPYGFGLSSGEPVVCSGVGAIGISVDLLAINGENNLPVGTNYNARYTGYDALYYLDRQSITITTNGLTWPNVTTIELDGTSGGAGMFATPTNTNLSGSPTAVRLFKA